MRLQAGDAKGIENVAQYIIRNSFSLAKLSYIEKTGTVIYRSKMSHGGNKHCGGLMKIVSFINEHRVIKKILVHLGLLRGEEQKRGPPTPPKKCSEVVVEPFDDGRPEYEESFTMVQG